MTKRRFYAREIVAANQPDDMRFVVAFHNKQARDTWIRNWHPMNGTAAAVAIPARHPEAVAARRKVASFREIGKRYGSRKIRYLPEEHAQTFGIVGAAWFVN